jgi:hypothetical protein
VGETRPPPTRRLSPLPRKAERLATTLPATSALLVALHAGGFDAEYPKHEAQNAVERAVTLAGVPTAAARILAAVAAKRLSGKEPKPWLGWYLDEIQGETKANRGPQRVGQDWTKTLAET